MKHERPSGRALGLLRPALVAAAAAAAWLALSATAASAETGADQLSGRQDTASFSVVPAALAPAGQSLPLDSGGSSSGLLSPVLGALTGSVHPAAAKAPFAPAVAAADAVSELASPVIDLAGGTAAGAVATIVPVTSGLLPVAGSVVDPLAGALAGVTPLPAPPDAVTVLPALPALPAPAVTAVPSADRGAAAAAQQGGAGVDADAVTVSPAPEGASAASAQQVAPRADGPRGVQPPADVAPAGGVPGGVPAPPGSGAGSSHSASGPAPGPAAEATAFELRPPRGLCEATDPLRQAPQPVSFDPGSSPD